MEITDHFDAVPIALYDVEDKKLVAVFRTKLSAAQYIFKSPKSSSVNHHLEHKTRLKKSYFDRVCCIRIAKPEQADILPEKAKFIILDDRYKL